MNDETIVPALERRYGLGCMSKLRGLSPILYDDLDMKTEITSLNEEYLIVSSLEVYG